MNGQLSNKIWLKINNVIRTRIPSETNGLVDPNPAHLNLRYNVHELGTWLVDTMNSSIVADLHAHAVSLV